MSLSGTDPQDPTPSTRREFVLGAAQSSGTTSSYPILVFANKVSAGTETVETIGAPFDSLDDCGLRFGLRSEMYQIVRKVYEGNPGALVYGIGVAEPTASSPTAASCTFTFVGAATDTTEVDIAWGGYTTSFTINTGDSIGTMATNLSNAINNASGGTWPMTASPSSGVVTVTMSQLGVRGTFYLTPLRVTSKKPSSVITTTITKSSVTNGTQEDTETLALAAAASTGEFRIHVSAKATASPTTSDGGVGEHVFNIVTQNLPGNGKSQVVFFGLVGAQSAGTTVTTASAVNSGYAYFFRQKNSDWSPGMIAGHLAGCARFQWLGYPAFNFIGYQNSDTTPFTVPPQYTKTDVASATEIKADLNNGVSTIWQDSRGRVKLIRMVTSRSLNATGQNDYKVREGHIPIVDFAYWDAFLDIWNSRKQPNVANDPPKGQLPLPLMTYPKVVKAWMADLARDFAGPNPLGVYPGPLLDPSNINAIVNSITAVKIGASGGGGGIGGQIDTQAVEHMVKSETKIRDVTASQ